MHRMLAAFGAELLILYTFRMNPLVLGAGIVLCFAFGAS